MSPAPAPRRSLRLRKVLLLAVLALAGCASTPKAPPPDVRWPAPPDKARVRWVRSFRSEDDLGEDAGRKLFKALVPTPSDNAVGQPTGLALSRDERTLYIASAPLGRVLALDRDTRRMRKIATQDGKRPAGPFGVGVDADDNVYLSDSAGNLVWVYSRKGEFLRKFGADHLDRPTGLAVDPRRRLVYVVSGVSQASKHHRIEVFSLDGKHVRTIGTRGAAAGEFNFPANVAVAKDGTLYVVDMLNFRIQVFDPEGQLLGMFGEEGAGDPGTFDKAKGLALDGFGNIYVTDSRWGFVQIFNARYQVLMAFSGQGDEPGSMRLPTAIVIDSNNTIFVADYYTHAVHEFQLVNTTADESFNPAPAAAPATSPATPAKTPGPAATPPGHNPQGGSKAP